MGEGIRIGEYNSRNRSSGGFVNNPFSLPKTLDGPSKIKLGDDNPKRQNLPDIFFFILGINPEQASKCGEVLVTPFDRSLRAREISPQMFQNSACVFSRPEWEHCPRQKNIELGETSDFLVDFRTRRRVGSPGQVTFVGKGGEEKCVFVEIGIAENLPEWRFPFDTPGISCISLT